MMTDYPSEGNGEEFKTINPIWAGLIVTSNYFVAENGVT